MSSPQLATGDANTPETMLGWVVIAPMTLGLGCSGGAILDATQPTVPDGHVAVPGQVVELRSDYVWNTARGKNQLHQVPLRPGLKTVELVVFGLVVAGGPLVSSREADEVSEE